MASPTDQYEAIAAEYRASKVLPFRLVTERPTLLSLLPDLQGKRVLDLGCGDGWYARQFRAAGAARVVGVDLSPAMVELARSQGGDGVEYHVADVGNHNQMQALCLGRAFDVVTGVYVLNYAADPATLRAMARVVADHLAPGGVFVGVNDNPQLHDEAGCRLYHGPAAAATLLLERRPAAYPLAPGTPVRYTLYADDGSGRALCAFDNYWLPPGEHVAAFAAVGYELRYHPLVKDAAAAAAVAAACACPAAATRPCPAHDGACWDAFVARPPLIGLRAVQLL